MSVKPYKRGKLEVIAGPMFAGKSSELLKRLLFIEHGGHKVLVLKPVIDDRYDSNFIVTHNQLKHPAVAVIDLELVKDNYTIKPYNYCLLYTSPSPRDRSLSRMPSSA